MREALLIMPVLFCVGFLFDYLPSSLDLDGSDHGVPHFAVSPSRSTYFAWLSVYVSISLLPRGFAWFLVHGCSRIDSIYFLSYGEGFDAGPPSGRGRVLEFLWVFAVFGRFLGLPAGFVAIPALF